METNKNMELYGRFKSVPKEACKSFSNGTFSGTDINPMWRIKCLTEAFGACGEGWYVDVTRQDVIPVADELLTVVNINLYTKNPETGEWSKPIFGTGGNKMLSKSSKGFRVSDEGFKMALTDAISVACKHLGIGADVYWEKDSSSKYAQYYTDGTQKGTNSPNSGAQKAQGTSAQTGATPVRTPQNVSGAITEEQCAKIRGFYRTAPQMAKLLGKYGVEELEELSSVAANGICKGIDDFLAARGA